MISIKRKGLSGLLLGGVMVLFSSFGEAKESAETRFTINVKPSTCDLTVQSTYSLGDLPLGTRKDYSPFDITITCPVSMKTAITARNLNGVLSSNGQQVAIPMSNPGKGKGPFFWLNYDSSRIYLRGLESDAFCSSTGVSRKCSLTPGTRADIDSSWGAGSVTIGFTVIYPA